MSAAIPISRPISVASFENWLTSDDTAAQVVRLLLADNPAARQIAEYAFRSGYIAGSQATSDKIFGSFDGRKELLARLEVRS